MEGTGGLMLWRLEAGWRLFVGAGRESRGTRSNDTTVFGQLVPCREEESKTSRVRTRPHLDRTGLATAEWLKGG